MEKKTNKNFNIPNILSVFRILLIPFFVVLYISANSQHQQYYFYAASILVLSGLTDLLDGIIARKYNQITNLGKILDPLADKLTQLTVVICVAIKLGSKILAAALMIFVIKEILMLIGGFIILRKKTTIQGSKWYGKIATAVFYVVMAAIAMFEKIPLWGALAMILVAAAFMLFAFFNYIREFFRIISQDNTADC